MLFVILGKLETMTVYDSFKHLIIIFLFSLPLLCLPSTHLPNKYPQISNSPLHITWILLKAVYFKVLFDVKSWILGDSEFWQGILVDGKHTLSMLKDYVINVIPLMFSKFLSVQWLTYSNKTKCIFNSTSKFSLISFIVKRVSLF